MYVYVAQGLFQRGGRQGVLLPTPWDWFASPPHWNFGTKCLPPLEQNKLCSSHLMPINLLILTDTVQQEFEVIKMTPKN